MITKKLRLPILAMLLALTALTACTKNSADDIGTRPAILDGQSEHWNVRMEYQAQGSTLKELPSIQYLGSEKLDEVTVNIIHNNQDPTVISVAVAPQMKAGAVAELTSDAKVINWKDTKQVEIEGEINDVRFKEYVYLTNTSQSTPTK